MYYCGNDGCAYAKTHDKMFHVKHSGNRKTVYSWRTARKVGVPAPKDYAVGGSFTPTCGASECGNASIAAGEASAMCRRETTGDASERGAGIPTFLASSKAKSAFHASTKAKTWGKSAFPASSKVRTVVASQPFSLSLTSCKNTQPIPHFHQSCVQKSKNKGCFTWNIGFCSCLW